MEKNKQTNINVNSILNPIKIHPNNTPIDDSTQGVVYNDKIYHNLITVEMFELNSQSQMSTFQFVIDNNKWEFQHVLMKKNQKANVVKVKKITDENTNPVYALKIDYISKYDLVQQLEVYNDIVPIGKKLHDDFICFVQDDQIKDSLMHSNNVKIYTIMPWYQDNLHDDINKLIKKKNTVFLQLPIEDKIKGFHHLVKQLIIIHKMGFAMNDLKPENIMIKNKLLYLIDIDSCLKIRKRSGFTCTVGYYKCNYSTKKNDAFCLYKNMFYVFYNLVSLRNPNANKDIPDKRWGVHFMHNFDEAMSEYKKSSNDLDVLKGIDKLEKFEIRPNNIFLCSKDNKKKFFDIEYLGKKLYHFAEYNENNIDFSELEKFLNTTDFKEHTQNTKKHTQNTKKHTQNTKKHTQNTKKHTQDTKECPKQQVSLCNSLFKKIFFFYHKTKNEDESLLSCSKNGTHKLLKNNQ